MPHGQTRSAPRRTRGKPNAVDIHVGQRLRQRRTLLGMSQERLAEALDLTFQQVQKYEKGTNRIGAGRLYQISRVLDAPVTYFFEGLDEDPLAAAAGAGEPRVAQDVMSRRETLSLVGAFSRIQDPQVRSQIVRLVRELGPHVTGSTADAPAGADALESAPAPAPQPVTPADAPKARRTLRRAS